MNRELDVLKPLLRSAVPKYLERNPGDAVKRFPPRTAPIAILSESAEDALLKVASPAERAMVLLGPDALLRLGDVGRLRGEHDRGDHLVITDPKTEPYKVPVSTRLREALDVLRDARNPARQTDRRATARRMESLKQLTRYDHPDDAEIIRAVEAIG